MILPPWRITVTEVTIPASIIVSEGSCMHGKRDSLHAKMHGTNLFLTANSVEES